MEKSVIHTENIQLDQFLKWVGAVESGGQVKPLLEEGLIMVNGRAETARRRRLTAGDIVEIREAGCWQVTADTTGGAGNEGQNP